PSQRSSVAPHLSSFPTRRSSDLQYRFFEIIQSSMWASQSNSRSSPNDGYQVIWRVMSIIDCRIGSIEMNHSSTSRNTRSVEQRQDRKSTRLNSSHVKISYAVFCL